MVPAQKAWHGFNHIKKAYNIWAETCQARRTAGINPQSSFISPIFVNDMPLHSHNSTIDIYAEDTTLSLSSNWNNMTSLPKALSNDLENIEKWSTENKMYINTEKTKTLLVTVKNFNNVFTITCRQMWTLFCMTLRLIYRGKRKRTILPSWQTDWQWLLVKNCV